MFSVKNKTIIVTGASGVIGSAISLALAKKGAQIIALGRNAEKLQTTFKKISAFGNNHLQIVCDVLDIESLKEANRMKFKKRQRKLMH